MPKVRLVYATHAAKVTFVFQPVPISGSIRRAAKALRCTML